MMTMVAVMTVKEVGMREVNNHIIKRSRTMVKIKILALLLGVCSLTALGQTGLTIAFAEGSPKKTETQYDIELSIELMVNDLTSLQELVVEMDGNETGKTEVLHKLPISFANNTYYLNGEAIYDGKLRYYTGFHKYQIHNHNVRLNFFAVDKSGNRSKPISYQLNP